LEEVVKNLLNRKSLIQVKNSENVADFIVYKYFKPYIPALPSAQLYPIYPLKSFGPNEWREYYGEVGDAPALPADIEQILDAPCPYYQAAKLMGVEEMEKIGKDRDLFYYKFWINKVRKNKPLKVKNTHLLTLIPKSVNGLPFNLAMVGKLIEKPMKGCITKYWSFDVYNHAEVPVDKSYWVLMPKDIMPGTRNKNFEDQKKVALFNGNYVVPKVIEVATSVLMHYVRTGEYLLSDKPYTYIRCEEVRVKDGYRVWVGGFGASGLLVNHRYYGDGFCYTCGCVCLRKFFGN